MAIETVSEKGEGCEAARAAGGLDQSGEPAAGVEVHGSDGDHEPGSRTQRRVVVGGFFVRQQVGLAVGVRVGYRVALGRSQRPLPGAAEGASVEAT